MADANIAAQYAINPSNAVDKVNGLVFKDAGYGVCLSDGDGCGDCFGALLSRFRESSSDILWLDR